MKKRLVILFLAVALLMGCGGTDNSNSASEATETSTEAEPYVLSFEGTTIEGEALASECFADSKLTMVNVWATFCGPCINEMPDLGEIADEYDPTEFQLIGIISDVIEGEEGDTFTEAQEIIAETGADYQHLLLNEELYVNLVGASDSVPTTYFFNEKGELLGYLVGAQTKEIWTQIIDGLLADME